MFQSVSLPQAVSLGTQSLGGEHLDKLLVVENPVPILVRLIDHLLHLLLRQLVT